MKTTEAEPITHDIHFILIVKENGKDRELVSAALKSSGYRVLEARDGKEGLTLFRQYSREIRLVMTDIVMSEMDGVDLVGRIREISSKTKVIFLSGQNEGVVRSSGEVVAKVIERRSTTPFTQSGTSRLVERRSPFTLLLGKVQYVLRDRGSVLNFFKRVIVFRQSKEQLEQLELEKAQHVRITQLWRSALLNAGASKSDQKKELVLEMMD
jgi:CheY-like chemotaxis protein